MMLYGPSCAAGCVLLADDSLLGPIVRRASALMPQVRRLVCKLDCAQLVDVQVCAFLQKL